MENFTYEKVTFNNNKGWFVTYRKNGVFAGKCFSATQKKGREVLLAKIPNLGCMDDYTTETIYDYYG
jgi:hypothetical protein